MKDRYLFKAKRLDNGEWVVGYYAVIGQRNVIIEKCVENYYCPDTCESRHGNQIHKVNSKTICQCTGLKDKNGKLIWENDVIKVCWQDNEAQCEEIAQVAWDEFGYYPWLDEYHCDGCDLFNEVLDIEVIGNIFDNKELLESEE